MYKIVLLRHGESIWNKENLFTGWTDVDLSARGREEATQAGVMMKEQGYSFDVAFTSVSYTHLDVYKRQVLGYVIEWASLHENELAQCWDAARSDQAIGKIEPLI